MDKILVHVKVFRGESNQGYNPEELSKALGKITGELGYIFFITDETVEMNKLPKELIDNIINTDHAQNLRNKITEAITSMTERDIP